MAKRSCNLPGPPHNLLWSPAQLKLLRSNFLQFMAEMTQDYGNVCGFRVGWENVCIINDPLLVDEVLTSRASEFYRTKSQKRLFGRIVGNGLIVSDGEHWQRHRRLAQPAFHQRQLATYFEDMAKVARQHVERWPSDQSFNVETALTRLTLEIVAVTLLGLQPPQDIEKLSTALADSQGAAVRLMKLGVKLPEWLPTPGNLQLKRSVEVMDSLVLPVIADKRRQLAAGSETGTDLLSMLISAMDSEDPKRRLSDEELRDEVVTMFLAGHDTTANLLTWTMYLLCKNPTTWVRLQREIDDVFRGEEPSADKLRNLKFTYMVLKEVMRLYPPVYLILREPVKDLTLGTFQLKMGQMVMLCPWLLHRDERYFEDAETFNPDRFTADLLAIVPPGTYIPFGEGPHQCIGRNFAVMEALLVLVTIAQKATPKLRDSRPVVPEPLITLGVRGEINITLEPRTT